MSKDIITRYENLLDDLISGKVSSEEASQILKEHDNMGVIKKYLNYSSFASTPLTDEDVQTLHALIEVLQFIYNDSGENPPISDTDYDKLYELMLYGGGDDIVGYKMVEGDNARQHSYPMLRGTLKKVYYLTSDEKRTNPSRKYLDEWKESAERMIFDATGEHIDLNDEEVYVFPKWDGVSAIQECDSKGNTTLVLTRGDTEKNIGYDCTKQLIDSIPTSGIPVTTGKVGVKYEVMVENDMLDYYNKKYMTDYKSTRSIASSIINSKDVDERNELLRPIPLRYIEKDGDEEIEKLHPAVFEYPYICCKFGDREKIREFAENNRYVNGSLRTDGAVIYIINPKIQKILGRTGDKNNFEVAYKFTEETAVTEITDIIFSVKNFGRITPIAVFKPVKIKGNTVKHATIGSKARFDDLELAKGDEVILHYDIIPYITRNPACQRANRPPVPFTSQCPVCYSQLNFGPEDAIVKCDNPDCPSKAVGKIINYLTKMKIKNISYATVNLLHKHGFLDNIKDLYKLEKHRSELIHIPSMGIVKVEGILSSIRDRGYVADYELFGALGIEGIAKETFRLIFANMSPSELMSAVEDHDINSLAEINGIGDKKAEKIISGLYANRKLISFLSKHVDVFHDESTEAVFTVCFSRIRDNDGELTDIIRNRGGIEVDSVRKDTDLLIVSSLNDTSSKITRAQSLGIPVIEFAHAAEYIKNHWDRRKF